MNPKQSTRSDGVGWHRSAVIPAACAVLLSTPGLAQAQTYWNLLETTGGIDLGGVSTPITNHNTGPTTCDPMPDWSFGNGPGLSDSLLISEDGGLNGVYFYAAVQYTIESSSAGQGPMSLTATRTLEARVGTIEDGVQTTNVPDIGFLQAVLPSTPVLGTAAASFDFQAFQCCPTCPFEVDCDLLEVDLGEGFETVCGEFTGECSVRWLAGATSARVLFEWDPTGNGGMGSLSVGQPVSLTDTAIITPAPSTAMLNVLGLSLASKRRRR